MTFTETQCVRAECLATHALAANSSSVSLRNNRAVARAYLGDLHGALEDVKASLGCDGRNTPYLLATIGLIAYRSGDTELGELSYRAAVTRFVNDKDAPSATLATLFWLRELARLGDPSVETDLAYIKRNLMRLTANRSEPEITSMIEAVEVKLAQGSLAIAPPEAAFAEDARDVFQRFNPPVSATGSRGRFLDLI